MMDVCVHVCVGVLVHPLGGMCVCVCAQLPVQDVYQCEMSSITV